MVLAFSGGGSRHNGLRMNGKVKVVSSRSWAEEKCLDRDRSKKRKKRARAKEEKR